MSHEAITLLTFHADPFRLRFNITVFLSNLPHGLFISPHGLFIHQKKLTVKVSYTSITAGTLSCCKYLSAAFQAQFCLHHSRHLNSKRMFLECLFIQVNSCRGFTTVNEQSHLSSIKDFLKEVVVGVSY